MNPGQNRGEERREREREREPGLVAFYDIRSVRCDSLITGAEQRGRAHTDTRDFAPQRDWRHRSFARNMLERIILDRRLKEVSSRQQAALHNIFVWEYWPLSTFVRNVRRVYLQICLGVYLRSSRSFACSFSHAKHSMYRAFNAVFWKVGRIASPDVVVQLVLLRLISVCPYYAMILSYVLPLLSPINLI